MKKCNYCDSMVPDSTDYCSVMCRSMAREEYLEGAYPRRGRAAEEELATLRAEVKRLQAEVERLQSRLWPSIRDTIKQPLNHPAYCSVYDNGCCNCEKESE